MLHNRFGSLAGIALLLLLLGAPAVSVESKQCALCGMFVDEASPFSAKITDTDHTVYFCDIGELLMYLKENKSGPGLARVKDYGSGAWIDAHQAYYVHTPRRFTTPMGWSIASFKEKKDAEAFGIPVDFDGIMRRFK